MEMCKFIIEIHPDGTLTCCEYEDPREVDRNAYNRAWVEGYRQALIRCDDKISDLEALKGSCLSAALEYQGAVKVRDHMSIFYQKLYNNHIH